MHAATSANIMRDDEQDIPEVGYSPPKAHSTSAAWFSIKTVNHRAGAERGGFISYKAKKKQQETVEKQVKYMRHNDVTVVDRARMNAPPHHNHDHIQQRSLEHPILIPPRSPSGLLQSMEFTRLYLLLLSN